MSKTSRDAAFLQNVVVDATRGIITVDSDGRIVFVNDPMEALLGRDTETIVGMSVTNLLERGDTTLTRIRDAVDSVSGTGQVATAIQTPDGATVPVALYIARTEQAGDDVLTLTVTRREAATDRRREQTERLAGELFDHREQFDPDDSSADVGAGGTDEATLDERLDALNETRRRLATADTPAAVAETCVEAVVDVLALDLACLRQPVDGSLKSTAMTTPARQLVDENPGFEFGLSDAGRAYRTQEPVVRADESETATGDLLATSLHYPIGNHGVLTVASADEHTVVQARLDAVSLLAVGVETALERIDREQRLREQREPDHDDTKNGADTGMLLENILTDLIAAETRTEIEENVCARLASENAYAGAWVANVDATGDRLHPGARAGVDPEVLSVLDDTKLAATADGALASAIESGECVVLDSETLFADGEPSPDGSSESICLVPLRQGARVHGILVVHGATADSFDGRIEKTLPVIGDAISFALSGLENQRLLLSDEIVELEFQVTDSSCLSVALSETLDTKVSMQRTVQNADNDHLSYVRVEDTAADDAIEAAESLESVTDCRTINDHDYGCLLEVTRPKSGAEVMMEVGATMQRAEAESGRGTLVLETPSNVEVRRIVEAYQSYNPDSELLTKRRIDRPVQTARQLQDEIENDLTEKQLSAITSAFLSGYYEWPRESTAEEIADSMGISASTLHQHLRRAHQKILTLTLESSSPRRL